MVSVQNRLPPIYFLKEQERKGGEGGEEEGGQRGKGREREFTGDNPQIQMAYMHWKRYSISSSTRHLEQLKS